MPIPDFFFHHPPLLNDYREGASQEKHFKGPNQTLEFQAPSLFHIQPQIPSQWPELPEQLVQSQHRAFYCQEEEEQQEVGDDEGGLELGPLNGQRWGRRPNSSMDWYGVSKEGDG